MSLLPQQIIPQTVPFGTLSKDGKSIIIDKNWWLLLYNLCQQVLAPQGISPATILQLSASDTEASTSDLSNIVRKINELSVLQTDIGLPPIPLNIPTDGRLINVQVLTTGTTAYTPTQGTKYITLIGVGDGGGGAGVAGSGSEVAAPGGGGGGAFGCLLFYSLIANPNTPYVLSIGGGGAGGASGGNNGTAGAGTTVVDSTSTTLLDCPGGNGAATVSAGASTVFSIGATGGNAPALVITPSFGFAGQAGFPGINIGGTGGMSGQGANGLYGSGGAPKVNLSGANGAPGTGYGSGGSSGFTGSANNKDGGAGAPGVIIVYEYS